MIWSLFGRSIHNLLEANSSDPNLIVEKRYIVEIDDILGRQYSLGGKIDLYEKSNLTLSDYKVTSIGKIDKQLSDPKKEDWHWQLNMNAWLMERHGIHVDNLQIIALARDWRNSERFNYKASGPIVTIPFLKEPEDVVEAFIRERIYEHARRIERGVTQEDECSEEERWETKPVFAVMKDKQARAVKLFSDGTEATTWANAQNDKDKLRVVTRLGRRIRCESYCPVSDNCPGYQKYKEERSVS